MQGRQKSFHIGRGHGMLKNYYGPQYYCFIFAFQCLFVVVVVVPCVLCRFCRKNKDRFSSFQQGVHPLPDVEKFLIFLKLFKALIVLSTSPLQSLIYVYIL